MLNANQPRPRKAILTPRSSLVEPLLHDLGVTGSDLDDVRAFALRICRDRNSWSIANAGDHGFRRIKRHEAEAELRRALAIQNGERRNG